MAVSSKTITTPGGVTLYVDDVNQQRFYFLPTSLDLAMDEAGVYRFSLLFYQSDFPERGARLKMTLSPKYPQFDPADVADAVGDDVELVGIPFEGGEIRLRWPIGMAAPEPVQAVMNGLMHIEISLSQSQASEMHQLLRVGAESVRVFARLAYGQTTEPLPVRARINLRQTSALLHDRAAEDIITGMRLRTFMAELPPSAIELKARGDLASLPRRDMLLKCTPVLAPLIARATADLESEGLTFDDRSFRLRQTDQVEDAGVWVDVSKPRLWMSTWQGEWSMSDFRKQIEAEAKVKQYFPEVLHIPAVGSATVLVENLLTITPETVQEVQVTLKHKRLGSMEEEVVETRFKLDSGPVVQHTIPVITFTPFRYQHKVRLLIAPEVPENLVESVPPNPQWQDSDQPLVRVGKEYLPYLVVYASAREGVFRSVGRADIEFAAVNGEPPVVLARTELTAGQPQQWLFIRSLPSSTTQIRWRPVLYQDHEGTSRPVFGNWRTETKLWAMLDPWDVLPRESKKVQVIFRKGDTPEIQLVTIQLRSGSNLEASREPDIEWAFFNDETRTFTLWPESIFEQGFVYRYGVTLIGSSDTVWSMWKQGEGDTVTVNVENEFYSKRTIEVTMKAPWSESGGPNPSSRKGEIIFAEVNLNIPDAPDTQSRSFTFDKDNKGTCFTWNIRVRQGADRYRYGVDVLSLDGRMIPFGPYENDKEKLALQIICTHESNVAPPVFDVKEIET